MQLSRIFLVPACLLALVCAPATAYQDAPKAADDSAYLVNDAEFVFKLNLKQLINSGLMKKIGTDSLKDAIKNNEQVKGILDSAGIDPLKDIDSILVSGAGMDPAKPKDNKATIVIRGTFDTDKLAATLKKREEIRPFTEGGVQMFEFNGGDQKMVGAIVDKNTVALTTGKDTTVEIVKGGRKAAVTKEMKTATGKFGGKETMTMALVVNEEMRKQIENAPRIGENAAKIKSMTMALSITDSLALNITGTTNDEKASKALANMLDLGKNLGKQALAGNEAIPGFVGDILDAVKVEGGKEAVTADLKIAKETIDKVLKLVGLGG